LNKLKRVMKIQIQILKMMKNLNFKKKCWMHIKSINYKKEWKKWKCKRD